MAAASCCGTRPRNWQKWGDPPSLSHALRAPPGVSMQVRAGGGGKQAALQNGQTENGWAWVLGKQLGADLCMCVKGKLEVHKQTGEGPGSA